MQVLHLLFTIPPANKCTYVHTVDKSAACLCSLSSHGDYPYSKNKIFACEHVNMQISRAVPLPVLKTSILLVLKN